MKWSQNEFRQITQFKIIIYSVNSVVWTILASQRKEIFEHVLYGHEMTQMRKNMEDEEEGNEEEKEDDHNGRWEEGGRIRVLGAWERKKKRELRDEG